MSANERKIFKNVISYSVSHDHVLFVAYEPNKSYKLYLCRIEDVVSGKDIDDKNGRSVEEGAMIIGQENGGTRVWLQMPRGL